MKSDLPSVRKKFHRPVFYSLWDALQPPAANNQHTGASCFASPEILGRTAGLAFDLKFGGQSSDVSLAEGNAGGTGIVGTVERVTGSLGDLVQVPSGRMTACATVQFDCL